MISLLRCAFCVAAGWLASCAALADDAAATGETREFDVYVDDKPVGVHHIKIRDAGARTLVNMKSDVSVRVLFYRYTYLFESKEVWDGEHLIALDAQTNDNGKQYRLQLKRDAGRSVVRFRDEVAKIDPPHQTTCYSRLPPQVKTSKTINLLNVDDGDVVATTWSAGEHGEISLEDRAVRCRKWTVDGGLKAELWFDDAGWLVRQKTVEQGHRTELRLTSIQRE